MSCRVHHAILELSFSGAINLSPCPETLSSKRGRCSEGGTRAGLDTYAFNGRHTNDEHALSASDGRDEDDEDQDEDQADDEDEAEQADPQCICPL